MPSLPLVFFDSSWGFGALIHSVVLLKHVSTIILLLYPPIKKAANGAHPFRGLSFFMIGMSKGDRLPSFKPTMFNLRINLTYHVNIHAFSLYDLHII